MLTVEFLSSIMKSKAVSRDVLTFSGLDLDRTVDFYSLQTLGKIINSCFEIFKMGGLVFSLSVYKKIISLLELLLEREHLWSIHK